MLRRSRHPLLLVTLVLAVLILLYSRSFRPSRLQPTAEEIRSGRNILPDLRTTPDYTPDLRGINRDYTHFVEPVVNSTSPYPPGKVKPAGSNYTRCLVMARLSEEDTRWVGDELGSGSLQDMPSKEGELELAVYVVDDSHAKLTVPRNKGHEAMVYLTYIIDRYDTLPDVSIFMHAHRYAWHNNELLDRDAARMVRMLKPETVARHGYMNLRCHWEPGCPSWLHPKRAGLMENTTLEKEEEEMNLAEEWARLFPGEEMPDVVAQPCCAQFALSRDRIREVTRERYRDMRDWLIKTSLTDYWSGRIFEYTWQYIFAKTPVLCPSMRVCYCEGYGVCFQDAKEFDYWFELRFKHDELRDIMRNMNAARDQGRMREFFGKNPGRLMGEVEKGSYLTRTKEIMQEMDELTRQMDELLDRAIERGRVQ